MHKQTLGLSSTAVPDCCLCFEVTRGYWLFSTTWWDSSDIVIIALGWSNPSRTPKCLMVWDRSGLMWKIHCGKRWGSWVSASSSLFLGRSYVQENPLLHGGVECSERTVLAIIWAHLSLLQFKGQLDFISESGIFRVIFLPTDSCQLDFWGERGLEPGKFYSSVPLTSFSLLIGVLDIEKSSYFTKL